MRRIILLTTLSLAWSIGCGSDKHPGNIEDPALGGSSAKGGHTSRGGSGGANSGGQSSGGESAAGTSNSGGAAGESSNVTLPGAPLVHFVSPPSNIDPNSDAVIKGEELTVTCKAEAAPEPGSTLDPATTKITLHQNGNDLTSDTQVRETLLDGARATVFNLLPLKTGLVTFECTAQDDSSEPITGKSPELQLLLDRGPEVSILAPSANQNVALGDGIDIKFSARAQQLADGDTRSNVTKVTVMVGGIEVNVPASGDDPGIFSGHVSLNDPKVFPPGDQPSGETKIQVIATNARGAKSSKFVIFGVDSLPPTISITAPSNGDIAGRTTAVKFLVEDKGPGGVGLGAGVDSSTVAVRINSGAIHYYNPNDAVRWQHNPGTPEFTFVTEKSDFSSSVAQATINVTASDLVHNATPAGVSVVVFLDTVPPIVSLDPPTVREVDYYKDISGYACSNAFDPLGEAINDLTIDNGADTFRALVWDDTVHPLDNKATRYFSLTDQSRVALYFQDDLTQPLLIDTDEDGICDDVDRGPDNSRAPIAKLMPILPTGNPPANDSPASFDATDDIRYYPPPPTTDICTGTGAAFGEPVYRCKETSDMVRVINHNVDSEPKEPVIYGIGVRSGTGVDCTGTYWEYSGFIKRPVREGWVCFVAVAYDKVNNLGVSPPLRLCYDDPATNEQPDCAKTAIVESTAWNTEWKDFIRHSYGWNPFPPRSADPNVPSCTKSCTLPTPDYYRHVTNQLHD